MVYGSLLQTDGAELEPCVLEPCVCVCVRGKGVRGDRCGLATCKAERAPELGAPWTVSGWMQQLVALSEGPAHLPILCISVAQVQAYYMQRAVTHGFLLAAWDNMGTDSRTGSRLQGKRQTLGQVTV